MKAFGIGLIFAIGAAAATAAQTPIKPSDKRGAGSLYWIRKPTGDDYAATYPPDALRKEQPGRALIRCQINEKGRLKDCAILAEIPQNAGFGQAALKVSELFQAPAGTAGAEVMIPLRWVTYPGPSPRTVLVKNPHFIATPVADDVIAAFPKAAIGHADKGVVRLRCGSRGCAVSGAVPARMGFEEAALTLSKKFRLDPVWSFNLNADEVQYDVAIQLAPADDEVWKTRPLGHVAWVQTADPRMAEAAFPAEALKAGLNSGSAVIACTVAPTGALEGCRAESEDPPGLGFGQAVASVALGFVMNPWTDEGLPVAGARARLPIKLVHEAEPAAPVATPATKP